MKKLMLLAACCLLATACSNAVKGSLEKNRTLTIYLDGEKASSYTTAKYFCDRVNYEISTKKAKVVWVDYYTKNVYTDNFSGNVSYAITLYH